MQGSRLKHLTYTTPKNKIKLKLKKQMANRLYTRSELESTPSRLDNIEASRESRYRREGALFIKSLGDQLEL